MSDDYGDTTDLSDWANEADADIPSDPPRPMLWRLLVAPRRPVRRSAGGIVLPQMAVANQKYMEYAGQVVAMGELAFKSKLFEDMADIPKPGDWVVFGRHAGQQLLYRDFRFIVIDDKQVLAVIHDPAGLVANI